MEGHRTFRYGSVNLPKKSNDSNVRDRYGPGLGNCCHFSSNLGSLRKQGLHCRALALFGMMVSAASCRTGEALFTAISIAGGAASLRRTAIRSCSKRQEAVRELLPRRGSRLRSLRATSQGRGTSSAATWISRNERFKLVSKLFILFLRISGSRFPVYRYS